MELPCYIGLEQARKVLSEMGVNLTKRQLKQATDKDTAVNLHSLLIRSNENLKYRMALL